MSFTYPENTFTIYPKFINKNELKDFHNKLKKYQNLYENNQELDQIIIH
jgi:hypothetical protein